MQLITPETFEAGEENKPKCYATTYGISESDKEVIEEQVSSLYGVDIGVKMASLECNSFFTEYWRSLAF